MEKYDEGNVGC